MFAQEIDVPLSKLSWKFQAPGGQVLIGPRQLWRVVSEPEAAGFSYDVEVCKGRNACP